MGGFSRRKNTTGIGVTRGRTGGLEGIRHTRDTSNVTLDVTHVTLHLEGVLSHGVRGWTMMGGGVICIYRELFFLVHASTGGYLVLYRDTGQGTAQGLDNAAGSSLGHALPRHIP